MVGVMRSSQERLVPPPKTSLFTSTSRALTALGWPAETCTRYLTTQRRTSAPALAAAPWSSHQRSCHRTRLSARNRSLVLADRHVTRHGASGGFARRHRHLLCSPKPRRSPVLRASGARGGDACAGTGFEKRDALRVREAASASTRSNAREGRRDYVLALEEPHDRQTVYGTHPRRGRAVRGLRT